MTRPRCNRRPAALRRLSPWWVGFAVVLASVTGGTAAADQEGRPMPTQSEQREAAKVQEALKDARNLMRLGSVQKALDRLARQNEETPGNTSVIQMYGQALQRAGQREEALELYRGALETADDPHQLYVELQRMHRQAGELHEAFDVCLRYHARYGDRGRWVANEMESLIRSDKLGIEAVEMIEAALKDRPDDDALRDLHVTALFYNGQTEEALETATELDAERKARGNTLFRYAELAAQKNAHDDAVMAIDRALAGGGPSPSARKRCSTRKRRSSGAHANWKRVWPPTTHSQPSSPKAVMPAGPSWRKRTFSPTS